MCKHNTVPVRRVRGCAALTLCICGSLWTAQAMMGALTGVEGAYTRTTVLEMHGAGGEAGELPSDSMRPTTPPEALPAVASWQRAPATFAADAQLAGMRSGSDNDCADATAVPLTDQGDGHYIGSEILAFTAPLSEIASTEYPTCHGGHMVCNNVWRTFTAMGTDATIDCCTSSATAPDSIIEVYSGTCSSRTPIACNDNSRGCGTSASGEDVGARVLVTGLMPGHTYIVQAGVRKYGTSGYTEGYYRLSIDCYTTCTIDCSYGARSENELQPCGDSESAHINDGCNMEPQPLFAQISCNEAVCGTSMFDGTTRDTDYYRWFTPAATNIVLSAKAEFVATLVVLGVADPSRPLSCDNYTILAENDPNLFIACADPGGAPATCSVGPGEYWLFIAPCFDFGLVACGKQYELMLSATPCYATPGACCVNGSCMADTYQEDCEVIYGGVWYGDGVWCADITCFECPAGAGVEDTWMIPDVAEEECDAPYYYPDVWNSGCGADIPDPTAAFTPINCGETICGTSGTHLAPPADPATNLRDNDWFVVPDIPGAPGDWYRVRVEYLGEFPAEIHIVSHWDIDHACESMVIEETRYAAPGELIELSACVKKKDYAPAGQAWVIVRPNRRGAPREVPCGVRYYLTVDCASCNLAGACCLGESGCHELTAAGCDAAGGTFHGEGIACDDPIVCCPCEPDAMLEDEPDCGSEPLNNGCWAAEGGPPWLFAQIPVSGTHVCGTLGDGDMDWYIYDHDDGILHWCVTSERSVRMLVLIPESEDPSTWCADEMDGWQHYTTAGVCEQECMELPLESGRYFLVVLAPGSGAAMPCPTYYDAFVTWAEAPPPPTGACADGDGNCSVVSGEEACDGTYLGDDSKCGPSKPRPLKEMARLIAHGVIPYYDPIRARENWTRVRRILAIRDPEKYYKAVAELAAPLSLADTIPGVGGTHADSQECAAGDPGADPPDCNLNGIPDAEDIETGTSTDCNNNHVPDECDIAFNTSMDATWNGIPDECETTGVVYDVWRTPAELIYDFGLGDAIPVGFFSDDPNVPSAAYTGIVKLIGDPPASTDPNYPPCFNDTDTIIVRGEDPFDRSVIPPEFPYEAPVSVPAQIVALSLKSTEPIIIGFSDGHTEAWNVHVALSSVPPAYGWLTVTRTHCHGGTFTTDSLPAQPLFAFVRVSDQRELILDSGLLDPPWEPIVLEQPEPQHWATDVHPSLGWQNDAPSDFHASVEYVETTTSCDCNENYVRDDFDIARGTSLDEDGDGVPDECEGPPLCPGDMNCDGIVNYTDIDWFVVALGCVGGDPGCWPPPSVPANCPWLNADCNGDDNVTYADIAPFVGRIGATCP